MATTTTSTTTIVRIHPSNNSSESNNNGLEEKIVLEFQGELVGATAGELLGKIVINEEEATAQLEVGAYLLKGEVIALKKPYLVIENEMDGEGKQQKQQQQQHEFQTQTIDMKMIALVKRRIIFRTRPLPKPIYTS